MQNFQNTFKIRKRSFISAFSIFMTVPLSETRDDLDINRYNVSTSISVSFINKRFSVKQEANMQLGLETSDLMFSTITSKL